MSVIVTSSSPQKYSEGTIIDIEGSGFLDANNNSNINMLTLFDTNNPRANFSIFDNYFSIESNSKIIFDFNSYKDSMPFFDDMGGNLYYFIFYDKNNTPSIKNINATYFIDTKPLVPQPINQSITIDSIELNNNILKLTGSGFTINGTNKSNILSLKAYIKNGNNYQEAFENNYFIIDSNTSLNLDIEGYNNYYDKGTKFYIQLTNLNGDKTQFSENNTYII